MNIVIQRMGLRRRRKKQPSGGKDDIYRLLYTNWARCRRVYADERQRLQMGTGILLSYISGARLVSLFDTRVTQSEDVPTFESEQLGDEACTADSRADSKYSEGSVHGLSKLVEETTIEIEDSYSQTHAWLMGSNNSTSTKRKQALKDDNDHEVEEGRKILRKRIGGGSMQGNKHASRETGGDYTDIDPILEMDSDIDLQPDLDSEDDSSQGHAGSSVFSDLGEDTDTNTEYADDAITDEEEEYHASDLLADDSSVTDDGYDAGPEKTGAVVWRHISFHIFRHPEPGKPNILLARVTLLHTKMEDKKPRTYGPLYSDDVSRC
jgi:hypothetical protein